MTLVITGSSSFIGKALIRQCGQQKIDFVGIDATGEDQPPFYKADIRSRGVADLIPQGADAVIHLAALSRDPDCRGKAYDCFDINVMGTLNLAAAAAAKNVRQFIFASSEWVYDNFVEGEEKTEDSPINIANLTSEYALSKIVSETNLKQRHQQGFCDVTLLRFGIIYGPRKDNWTAVESLMHAVKTRKEVSVGSLRTARRFIHVSDIASGILASVGLKGCHVINLQGEKLVSLQEVIRIAGELLRKSPRIVEKDSDGANIRPVSGAKAEKLLNWRPQITLRAGLESLLDWV